MASSMLRQVRPFTGPRLSIAAPLCGVRVTKVKSHYERQHVTNSIADEERAGSSSNLPVATCIALGAIGFTAQRAIADEAALQATSTLPAEDVEVLVASSSGSGIEPLLVSLLFGVVVLLLVVVTGGVAYMNISQWLDNRQEKEDREKAGKEVEAASSASGATGGADGGEVISLKRASRIKKEKGKGFAAAEFTSRR